MDDIKEFLTQFADYHVVKSFRTRFTHEAINKPHNLQSRICHSVDEVFSSLISTDASPFALDEMCIAICTDGQFPHMEFFAWSEYQNKIGYGLGVLIASEDASRFYCETEYGYGCPHEKYRGEWKK